MFMLVFLRIMIQSKNIITMNSRIPKEFIHLHFQIEFWANVG